VLRILLAVAGGAELDEECAELHATIREGLET
jgi:hypothetical protein